MIYDIRHVTRFHYGNAAQFARCNLRLKPIDWAGQNLERYRLSIMPTGRTVPVRASAGLANIVRLTIEEPVRQLTIESVSRITVDRMVPMIHPDDPTIAQVAQAARACRDPSPMGPSAYLYPSPLIPLDRDIADWCAEELTPDRRITDAAIALAQRIQREFAFDPTATLVDTPPHDAFVKRGGVCQDFAQIMISGLRAAGLAAAYASGYIRTIPPPGQERLIGADATHAWVMLWCGDVLGWIGVDPTNGIWMAGDHIVMAVGRDYAEIAPIDGIVLGSGMQQMDVTVDVAPLETA
ncbi:MAG: transglutaminase family protein [Sphingomonas sp.]|nr:transglutaminase family protein [Sphingomonas sp.]